MVGIVDARPAIAPAGRPIEINLVSMLTCPKCPSDSTVESDAQEKSKRCPLKQLIKEFENSGKTTIDLFTIATRLGIAKTFYTEPNGVAHFKCPENETDLSGRVAILPLSGDQLVVPQDLRTLVPSSPS